MQIRPATSADLPFLWEMLYAAIHVEPGEAKPPRSILDLPNIAHYLSNWGRPGDRAYIAEVEGRPVGAAWFRLMPADDPGYGHVSATIPELTISVLAECQGQGIGTALMHRLIKQAEADGFAGISLSVDPRNAALRLYQRLGFQFIATDEGGSWTMLKELAQASFQSPRIP